MERLNCIRPGSDVFPSLADNEIHLWYANVASAGIMDQQQILSDEEQAHAARFQFQKDRQRYIFSHTLLRILLGNYLSISPHMVQFRYGRYGKPFVRAHSNLPDIRFNMSHSGSLVLYGIARGYELGVDVALIRQGKAHLSLAERFFAPVEVEMLRALPAEDRTVAFFNCWTRKEAFIKATGNGQAQGLDTFAVSLAPGETPSLLWLKDDPAAIWRWSLIGLDLGADYVGAVAFEKPRGSMKIVFRSIGE